MTREQELLVRAYNQLQDSIDTIVLLGRQLGTQLSEREADFWADKVARLIIRARIRMCRKAARFEVDLPKDWQKRRSQSPVAVAGKG